MKSKLFIGLVVFLFSIVLVTSSAFAAIDITTIYTVASSGDFTQKSTFDLTETPWLYFQLPSGAGDQQIKTYSSWYDPNSNQDGNVSITNHPDGTTNIWHSLSNWDTVKEEGDWSITASFDTRSPNRNGTGSTTFTVNAEALPVVPEPVSSILFLTGGATLALRSYRRKKQSA